MAEGSFTLDFATWHRAFSNGDDDAFGPLAFPAPSDDIAMLLERLRLSSRISSCSRESLRATRLVLHWWRLAIETAA
jgi:hypothetical protein